MSMNFFDLLEVFGDSYNKHKDEEPLSMFFNLFKDQKVAIDKAFDTDNSKSYDYDDWL